MTSILTIPRLHSPFRDKVYYKPTAGLTSTCPKTKVKDYPINSGVLCGQHFESPSRYLLSRWGLPPHISSCPNLWRCWFGTNPPCRDQTRTAACMAVSLSLPPQPRTFNIWLLILNEFMRNEIVVLVNIYNLIYLFKKITVASERW